MTDARFPERWLNDRRILRLTDVEFRSFVLALTWSVSNRTDGVLDAKDMPLIPGFRSDTVPTFERSGLWEKGGNSWAIVEFADTQSTKLQLEGMAHRRLLDRNRQAKKRATDKGDPEQTSRDSPRDVMRDVRGSTKASASASASAGKDLSSTSSWSSEDEKDEQWKAGKS